MSYRKFKKEATFEEWFGENKDSIKEHYDEHIEEGEIDISFETWARNYYEELIDQGIEY